MIVTCLCASVRTSIIARREEEEERAETEAGSGTRRAERLAWEINVKDCTRGQVAAAPGRGQVGAQACSQELSWTLDVQVVGGGQVEAEGGGC